MSGTVEFRAASPEEFGAVARMHYRSWRQSYTGIVAAVLLDLFDDPRHWAEDVYPEKLSRSGWSMRLAASGAEPVGLSIIGPDDDRPDRLEIDALYVAPDQQRRRVGSLLLADALALHPSADVMLWCAEQNHRARRFYEAHGFRRDGRTLNWQPIPAVDVPQLGYALERSAARCS